MIVNKVPLPFINKPLDDAMKAVWDTHGEQMLDMIFEHPMMQEIPGVHQPEVKFKLRERFRHHLKRRVVHDCSYGLKEVLRSLIKENISFYIDHLRPIWKETYPKGVEALEKLWGLREDKTKKIIQKMREAALIKKESSLDFFRKVMK